MTDLTDLIVRLEKATGPDRELDAAILNLGVDPQLPWYWCDAHKTIVTRNQYGPGAVGNPVCSLEHFTGSIDDALTLMPEAIYLKIETISWENNWPVVKVFNNRNGKRLFTAQAITLPIALCIAALKVRQSSPESQPPQPIETEKR